MLQAILFDADHTLYQINAAPAYGALYQYLSRALKLSLDDVRQAHQAVIDRVRGATAPALRRREYAITQALQQLSVEADPHLVESAMKMYWREIVQQLVPAPDVLRVVRALKTEYRLAIASDEFLEPLTHKLNAVFSRWGAFFEFLITPELTHMMKPAARFYELALERWPFPAQSVLMVGDSWKRDLAPAQAIGLRTMLISDRAEGMPDRCIVRLAQLVETVKAI